MPITGVLFGRPVRRALHVRHAGQRVSLDFDRYDHVDEHHYAFQLGEEEFKAAFSRIRNQGITHYADPACREPGQTYTANGRCGTYFRDPDGHLMEILTPVPPAPM
jgi:catechol 2,3-dioxygenase-like lactoylglutathione lyase family enzyme